MDQTLKAKLGDDLHGLQILDAPEGKLKLKDGSEYALLPIAQLWGPGQDANKVNPREDRTRNLELNIEAAVLELSHKQPGVTDAKALIAYDTFAQNPEADPRGDVVMGAIQRRLRAFLSLHDFNKLEVRNAFRRLAKNVQKHAKGGNTAYLEAIHGHVPHHH